MTTIERFQSAAASCLVWLPERGMGIYRPALRSRAAVYDQPYWDRYESYAANGTSEAITRFRSELVDSYVLGIDAFVVDVGIGCGEFVKARGPETFGYDVNPVAVEWLKGRGRWGDPYTTPFTAATFWDAIEHIEDPGAILANIVKWVFVTLPIFRDAEHVIRSKHFKPEHIWYWTRDGFVRWMEEYGFTLESHGTQESYLGREDSHTFVFRRREVARAAAA